VTNNGQFRTTVRGLGPDGRTTWRREAGSEAGVTVDPTGENTAVCDGEALTLLDAAGRTVWTRNGVRAARFTPEGELVILTGDDRLQWLPARESTRQRGETP
jgi:hypothetical protein